MAEFFEQSLKFTIRDKGAKEFIVNTQWEGLDVMPSSPLLDELHSKLESRHKIYKLRDALELLAEELRAAHRALGRILGEYDIEDLLGEIFSRFCIGK